MAPVRSSTRRGRIQPHSLHALSPASPPSVRHDLFIDPMLGSPLGLYIEKDVDDKETLVNLITAAGGTVATSYSSVTYILVDPLKPSGQSLYRQYASKKGKIVLDSRWVHECISAGELQAFAHNWAGCKVIGNEIPSPSPMMSVAMEAGPSTSSQINMQTKETHRKSRPGHISIDQTAGAVVPPQTMLPQAMHAAAIHVDNIVPPQFYPSIYMAQPRPMQPAVPQTWQASSGIAPQQTQHMPPQPPPPPPPPPHGVAPDSWDSHYDPTDQDNDALGGPGQNYDYRYRDDQPWAPPHPYYDHAYAAAYDPQGSASSAFLEPSPVQAQGPVQAAESHVQPEPQPHPHASTPTDHLSTTIPEDEGERRGRKRNRTQSIPAPPTSSLVTRKAAARSPSPPSRVIKSTYGGNLFTTEDVDYLKKYIDYCQEQGLVLSLREICLRVAVKAPHHTFYSWRRYCNKHQIRLGGYTMTGDRDDSPGGDGITGGDLEEEEEEEHAIRPHAGFGTTIAAAQERVSTDVLPRTRSPTPPRALFRSTTGKGVAFTVDDIAFLIRFMDFRKAQDRLDMVSFWKDVAQRAPHHSRASWMKFWRRHKHELNRTEADGPLPQPPEKKMRYSREDDILLAKYFLDKHDGTSDQVFQNFGRMNTHHPWKGWQEHYRIHKVKIDHFTKQLANGESILAEI